MVAPLRRLPRCVAPQRGQAPDDPAWSRTGQRVFGGVGRSVLGLAADELLDALEDVLADDLGKRYRVLAIEARPAQARARLLRGGDQAVQRHVAERIGTDRSPDAIDIEPISDQL